MEKLIHDQIDESNGSSELRNAIFESCLFGTGIIKGPFNYNKLYIVGKTVKKQVNVNITRYLSEFLALSLFLFGTSFPILALLA